MTKSLTISNLKEKKKIYLAPGFQEESLSWWESEAARSCSRRNSFLSGPIRKQREKTRGENVCAQLLSLVCIFTQSGTPSLYGIQLYFTIIAKTKQTDKKQVPRACNLINKETKARGLPQVQGQSELHREYYKE